MKTLIGSLIILLAIALGIYAGIWWALIGGIVAIIHQCQAPTIDAMALACGMARAAFFAPIGWLTFFVIGGIGYSIIPGSSSRRRSL